MSNLSINVHASNIIFVCIDDHEAHNLQGRAYHKAGKEPIRFRDISAMILEADEILESLGCPQAAMEARTFGKKRAKATVRKKVETVIHDNGTDQKGEKATFIVQVQYRQNATWQGNVVWAERNEKKPFRSALELIKLMDSALEESNVPE